MHLCPVLDCAEMVPNRRLMCRRHWYMVPKRLRDAVWAAYREHGVGSRELTRAQGEAIAAVEEAAGVL